MTDQHIKINSWSKYQSYKDRKPPWIRFHRSILDDYQYQTMSAEARALLPMLWLLACENEDPKSGIIELKTKEIAFRLRQSMENIEYCLKELQAADFIECIETVTEPLKNSIQTVTPETETETETETDKEAETKPRAPRFKPPTVDQVAEYVATREVKIDPQAFVDHYEATGWIRGKTKIKDWKACVRTWERNNNQSRQDGNVSQFPKRKKGNLNDYL